MQTSDGRMPAVLAHLGAEYVPEGFGDRWVPMRCPLHDDRHASAQYNEALDSFSCMACNIGGNAVTLLMKHDGLSARDADRKVTEISGAPGTFWNLPARSARRSRTSRYVSPRLRRRVA